ncbi:dihydrodipicolinate synthase family protein [Halobellus clavatus]|uniref:4-hydroxy-tetrahydrodipicolinate synthase n=1 Tax=Halobellus clavatus TaxID=660517 RepID=A0A1H3GEL5_9EURY|nr:dihydrodipicolinate synthase family protein [Halobellus clavatus]SDY01726.1 4-hydroxy-tetrahydrodipicolinate synthase [Halobellus clavatus]
MKSPEVGTLLPPLVTPFADGEIDWESFDELLTHVVDGGVSGVFPCGTTGEFASLTRDERRKLVEHTVDVVGDDVSVIAGGTGTSVGEAINWLETLDDLGVDAGVVTAPYYHNSNGEAGVRRFFEAVADASPLPLFLYNIPGCVGERIPIETVVAVADHDAVCGLKDSSGDFTYGVRAMHRTPEDFRLLQGYDSLLLPSLRMGFDGGINALSNVVPGAYSTLVDDPAGARAERIHRDVIDPLFEYALHEGFAPATKALLVEREVLSANDVRPPLVADTVSEVDALAAAQHRY